MKDKTLIERIRKHFGISEEDFMEDARREEARHVNLIRSLARTESAILDAKCAATFQRDKVQNRIDKAFEEIHMARIEVSDRVICVPDVRTVIPYKEGDRVRNNWEFNKDWYRKLESDAEKLAEGLAELRKDLNALTYRSHNHASIHRQICMIETEMLILQESIKTAHKEMERRI